MTSSQETEVSQTEDKTYTTMLQLSRQQMYMYTNKYNTHLNSKQDMAITGDIHVLTSKT